MVRLLFLLLTTRWGLTIVGALLTIGGLVYGIGSHAVTYQSVSQDTVIHYLSPADTSSSTGYLQLQNDPNLYVINESDFTPPLTGNSFGMAMSLLMCIDQIRPPRLMSRPPTTSLIWKGMPI